MVALTGRSRVAIAVAVIVLCSFTQHSAAVFQCCANIATGAAYSDCNCLEDNTWRVGEVLAGGQSMHFHWRLTDWSMINVPDDQRPSITFKAHPCTGSVELYIKPLQTPFPHSGTARWSSTYAYEPNEITTQMVYSEYFVTVTATAATNFSIAAIIDQSDAVVPGNQGAVAALAIEDDEKILFEGDTMSMNIQFTAAALTGAEYRVYAAPTGEGQLPCQASAPRSGCILATMCGLQQGGMQARTGWVSYGSGEVVSVIIDELVQNQPYYFNVAVRHNGNTAVYVPTQGTPTYLRVTQAQDDGTVLLVAVIAGAVFVVLVILILWARVKLQKAYHQRHQSRTTNRFHRM